MNKIISLVAISFLIFTVPVFAEITNTSTKQEVNCTFVNETSQDASYCGLGPDGYSMDDEK